jgi:hypothetical protein
MESFDKVKDVFESQFLKQIRISNLHKALRLGIAEHQKVKIQYLNDRNEMTVNEMVTGIMDDVIALGNERNIPIRAIKSISFN